MAAIVSIVIALAVFIYGAYIQNPRPQSINSSEEIVIQKSPPIASPQTSTVSETIFPSTRENIQPTEKPILYPDDLSYPDSVFQSQQDNIYYFETEDAAEAVYSWYKDSIDAKNGSIKNTVKTQANDQFKGVLSFTHLGTITHITIEQNSEHEATNITIKIQEIN